MKISTLRASGALSVEKFGRLLVHAFRAGRQGRYVPIMVWGEAGVGKSETVARTAKRLGVGFKDLRLGLFEAPDLLGVFRQQEVFPCFLDFEEGVDPRIRGRLYTRYSLFATLVDRYPERVREAGVEGPDQIVSWAVDEARKRGLGHLFGVRTVNAPPSWLPQPGTTGFLFLDEFNRATREVKQGSFQLVLDRTVGQIPLPAGWIVVSANNPPDIQGNGMGYGMVDQTQDSALLSRFCHVSLEPSVEEWLSWARLSGIDARVRAFVAMKGSAFLGSGREVAIPNEVEPNPRAWAMLSRLVSPVPSTVPGAPPDMLDDDLVSAVAMGLVGTEATRTWFALRMVPDPLVEAGDLLSDYPSAYERLRKFLRYPTIDPTTGTALTDDQGRTIYTRRSDLVRVTFESMTDALRANAIKGPDQLKAEGLHPRHGDVKLIATALRLILDAVKGEEGGGFGMEDVGLQHVTMWIAKPTSGVGKSLIKPELFLAVAKDPAIRERFTTAGVDHQQLEDLFLQAAALRGHEVSVKK